MSPAMLISVWAQELAVNVSGEDLKRRQWRQSLKGFSSVEHIDLRQPTIGNSEQNVKCFRAIGRLCVRLNRNRAHNLGAWNNIGDV